MCIIVFLLCLFVYCLVFRKGFEFLYFVVVGFKFVVFINFVIWVKKWSVCYFSGIVFILIFYWGRIEVGLKLYWSCFEVRLNFVLCFLLMFVGGFCVLLVDDLLFCWFVVLVCWKWEVENIMFVDYYENFFVVFLLLLSYLYVLVMVLYVFVCSVDDIVDEGDLLVVECLC